MQTFVQTIDQAADMNTIYAASEAAEAAGMIGGAEPRNMSQRWTYIYTDGFHELHVHARWWNSSRPNAYVARATL